MTVTNTLISIRPDDLRTVFHKFNQEVLAITTSEDDYREFERRVFAKAPSVMVVSGGIEEVIDAILSSDDRPNTIKAIEDRLNKKPENN